MAGAEVMPCNISTVSHNKNPLSRPVVHTEEYVTSDCYCRGALEYNYYWVEVYISQVMTDEWLP